MNKNTFDFTELKKANRNVEARAGEVAKAEVEILSAEENLIAAKRDDGTIPPEELVKKIDNADRALRIRQIEANRVAAKLEEAEISFHGIIADAAESVIAALASALEKEKVRIKTGLTDIVGEVKGVDQQIWMIVGRSSTVIRIGLGMREITSVRAMIATGQAPVGSLVQPVMAAEAILQGSLQKTA